MQWLESFAPTRAIVRAQGPPSAGGADARAVWEVACADTLEDAAAVVLQDPLLVPAALKWIAGMPLLGEEPGV